MNVQSLMTPRTKVQFKKVRDESIDNIANAAMKLFSTKGYASVSVADIAKAAGISQGLLYNYFASKEKLLAHIIIKMQSEMTQLMTSVSTAETPEAKLLVILKLSFHMLQEQKEFWTLVIPIITQSSVSSKIRLPLSNIFSAAVLQFEEIFKTLKISKPREEALKLGAILDGIAWHYLYIFRDTYPLEDMKKKLINDYQLLVNQKRKAT